MIEKIVINNEDYDFVGIKFNPPMSSRGCAIITMEKPYNEMVELFPDGVSWKLKTIADDGTETIIDKSEYCLTGNITDTRDGKVSVVMSKLTDLERMIAIIYGGVNNGN